MTLEAIKALRRSADPSSKKILKAYKTKYLRHKKQANFLNKFVSLAWFNIFLFPYSSNIIKINWKNQVQKVTEKGEREKGFHHSAFFVQVETLEPDILHRAWELRRISPPIPNLWCMDQTKLYYPMFTWTWKRILPFHNDGIFEKFQFLFLRTKVHVDLLRLRWWLLLSILFFKCWLGSWGSLEQPTEIWDKPYKYWEKISLQHWDCWDFIFRHNFQCPKFIDLDNYWEEKGHKLMYYLYYIKNYLLSAQLNANDLLIHQYCWV